MFPQPVYEDMVRFASEGEWAKELAAARAEFIARTGDLFETDASFERRIAAFLEWYVFDRPVPSQGAGQLTPAQLYVNTKMTGLTTPEANRLRDLTHTVISLFEFKRSKNERLHVVDLLSGAKHQIFERRRPAALESGDILEARLVRFDGNLLFTEAVTVQPHGATKAILRAAKLFRKAARGANEAAIAQGRLDLVHRVAYLRNRCERYQHVPPERVFADL